jgi:hypothetical protein
MLLLLAAQHVRQLVFTHRLGQRHKCYVMVPLQHTRQRLRRWGWYGFHGIRTVGGGAQPLKQQSARIIFYP